MRATDWIIASLLLWLAANCAAETGLRELCQPATLTSPQLEEMQREIRAITTIEHGWFRHWTADQPAKPAKPE